MIMSKFLLVAQGGRYKEWLSLPCDLTINDSFADDLIQQFDMRRTGLHKDLEQEKQQQYQNQGSSSASSCQPIPISSAPSPPSPPSIPPKSSAAAATPTRNPRRSSAGERLRQSSALFRATLDSTWKNISRSHENLRNNSREDRQRQQQENDSDVIQIHSLPETIAIHTTITFPPITKKSSASSFSPLLLSPPSISQYPPKPLQYSPVTMPAEHSSTAKSSLPSPPKTLMHRLSMPALRPHASSSNNQHSAKIPFFIKRKKSSQL
ncbi:hypothetical protein BCR42DRAFT_408877 [Absidia repens]|uniref:Uncharacterized protein n=1 Tax=Absidia repens TaxID=90262 RepID=A0A1X2IRW4_9FUNG|nr:hypothetical protein BCR42DRAFT_408877 [Absidia repens]